MLSKPVRSRFVPLANWMSSVAMRPATALVVTPSTPAVAQSGTESGSGWVG